MYEFYVKDVDRLSGTLTVTDVPHERNVAELSLTVWEMKDLVVAINEWLDTEVGA